MAFQMSDGQEREPNFAHSSGTRHGRQGSDDVLPVAINSAGRMIPEKFGPFFPALAPFAPGVRWRPPFSEACLSARSLSASR
jgi:hypothetical protein